MSNENTNEKLTYKSAGVDIEKGDNFVESIKKITKNNTIGLYGNMFDVSSLGMKNPVLVSGTDGVGTKLKLAFRANKHDTIGIDLVAMCVNDILCHGAKPIFFLDYLANSSVDVSILEQIIIGINEGCKIAGCELAGGETAEMPDIYKNGEYDLAGFVVGAVEKERMLPSQNIKAGDCLIALPSSGIHSNGFSLVNAVLEKTGENSQELLEKLLTPTKIYVKDVLGFIDADFNKGILSNDFIEVTPYKTKDCKYRITIKDETYAKQLSNEIQIARTNIQDGSYTRALCSIGIATNDRNCYIAGNGTSLHIYASDEQNADNIYNNISMKYKSQNALIKGLAHITGGGLYSNTMRIIPSGLDLAINYDAIQTPEIFNWIQKNGNIETEEMFKVFNMGIGMVVVCKKQNLESVLTGFDGSYIFGSVVCK